MEEYAFTLMSKDGEHVCDLVLNEKEVMMLVGKGLETILIEFIKEEKENLKNYPSLEYDSDK